MRQRIALLFLLLFTGALGTRMWSPEELNNQIPSWFPPPQPAPRALTPRPRRFNYLKRVKWVCDFVARYQVSDSNSPDYGGVIEAEHLPDVIETDNTQEAIWVWTRWYQLTGSDDYRENIRRAWRYARRNPAYREHLGNPQNLWYAVWNCGLGMFAEPFYRAVYHDTTHRAYADSCRDFYLTQQLNPANFLDNLVTAQASGMAYRYALTQNDPELRDTALCRGIRVKNWLEAAPRTRLNYQNWAMSGATAFWGVANTFCRADTAAGRRWLETYADSLPGFYPSGTWNCAHNIWLAYAYRAAAELTGDERCRRLHHYLSDTLLFLDTDLDGGIPATWTDPNTQDQTWISTYLDFMGLDGLLDTIYNLDLAVYEILAPAPDSLYLEPCTLEVRFPIENVGRNPVSGIISCALDSTALRRTLENIPVWVEETLDFRFPQPAGRGHHRICAIFTADENPKNDTVETEIRVYGACRVSGRLLDTITGQPVAARLSAFLNGRITPWDSTVTGAAGEFTLCLLDSLFVLSIEPEPPYASRRYTLFLRSDTSLTLYVRPARVLVVNNDSLENFANYYTAPLDTLGISYSLWRRPSRGALSETLLYRLDSRTVIWFSGNSRTRTLPEPDREALKRFVSNGGNLLLTGQNIAEELAGSAFLESIAGCRFDSSGYRGFLVFGNRTDSLGRAVTGTSTAGGNGANNQYSRDVISPVSSAARFLVYDTTNLCGAGVRYQYPEGGRVVTLGFGFEAVNRPASRPNYLTRTQLLAVILEWLIHGTGVSEPRTSETWTRVSPVTPTVFNRAVTLFCTRPIITEIYDITGRKLLTRTLKPGLNTIDLSHLSAGVYLISVPNLPPVKLLKPQR